MDAYEKFMDWWNDPERFYCADPSLPTPPAPTIALAQLLIEVDEDDREDMLETIIAYADQRALDAIACALLANSKPADAAEQSKIAAIDTLAGVQALPHREVKP